MIESFARLEKIWFGPDGEPLKPGLLAELSAKARQDNHAVIAPNYVVIKDKEVVGYVSMANIPMVLSWISTKEMGARDSFTILHLTELLVQNGGWRSMCMPVDDTSPFQKLMPTLGYRSLAKADLFVKEINV